MKKLVMAIGFLFAAVLAVNAQDSTRYRRDPAPPDTTVQDQQDTTSIQYRTEDPARDTTSQSAQGEQDMSQDTTKTAAENQQDQYRSDEGEDPTRQEIMIADLPALVQEQLKSQDYAGWLVSSAYKKEKDGQTIYVAELKSGSETKKVKFDAQGNKLKEKDENDNKDNDQ